jgi:hypothetical protein
MMRKIALCSFFGVAMAALLAQPGARAEPARPVPTLRPVPSTPGALTAVPSAPTAIPVAPAHFAPSTRFAPSAAGQPPAACDGTLDDFEAGFAWTTTGGFRGNFSGEPLVNDVSPPGFVLGDIQGIAGDYWRTPFPNGHQRQYWAASTGGGTMTSPTFALADPFLDFLLAGGVRLHEAVARPVLGDGVTDRCGPASAG